MLKLSKLEVFAAVAEEGSFSAAADRLHLSQPAVSRHMQELEEALGIRLFKRQRRGVSLTTGGEILHQYTQKILWLVGEAEGALTNVNKLAVGQVRIGATPGVSVYLLPTWMRAFRATYPNLTVALRTLITPEVIDHVLSGRLDVGFVEGELEDVTIERLRAEVLQTIQLVVVVGPEHPWWDTDIIEGHALHEHPFITRQPGSKTRIFIDAALGEHAIRPQLVAELDNQEAIKEMVMRGLGVTILPTYAVQREKQAGLVHTITIADVPLRRSLKLLWDGGRSFSPVTRAFLTMLGETYTNAQAIVPAQAKGIFEE